MCVCVNVSEISACSSGRILVCHAGFSACIACSTGGGDDVTETASGTRPDKRRLASNGPGQLRARVRLIYRCDRVSRSIWLFRVIREYGTFGMSASSHRPPGTGSLVYNSGAEFVKDSWAHGSQRNQGAYLRRPDGPDDDGPEDDVWRQLAS